MGGPEPDFAALDQAALAAIAAGDAVNADRLWAQALALDASRPDVLRNHGAVLRRLGRFDAALARYAEALAVDPAYAPARTARANLLNQLGRHDEALADARATPDDDAAGWNAAGVALAALGRNTEARTAWLRAAELAPSYADPRLNLGNLALDQSDAAQALEHYRQGAALAPGQVAAWTGQGHALSLLGRWSDAVQAYDRAAALDEDAPWLAGYRLHARMKLCDWDGFDGAVARIGERLAAGQPASHPFPLVAIPSTPATQRVAAGLFARGLPPEQPLPAVSRAPGSRIRVAYVSADFHAHATGWLMVEMLERHDRSAFEVIALSYGPATGDPTQQRLYAACERVFDIRSLDDASAVDLARSLDIDIAIDLKGYTAGARPALFARRLAPVQVSYFGFPCTMSLPAMDYLIADSVLIPPGAEAHYAETILRLSCYQPNDRRSPRPQRRTSRADHGLPEGGFVFGAFNNPYKITPGVFGLWMRLLKDVPASVLWVFTETPETQANLRAAAARAGVDPARLVFAGRLGREAHLERHHHIDLLLDTSPCAAHTTASDALWMGAPLVTLLGETLSGRVAASLLHAAGLPDLAAESWDQYRDIALTLARDPARLAAVRHRLESQRGSCRLFDTETHVRELEALYRTLTPA